MDFTYPQPEFVREFTVLVAPESVQHGSRHFYNPKAGAVVHASDPKKQKYLTAIKREAKRFAPTEVWRGPIRVRYDFFFPRPERLKKCHPGPIPCSAAGAYGDWDNLAKGTQDGLTKAGFWENDKQIFEGTGARWYTSAGGDPFIQVRIEFFRDFTEEFKDSFAKFLAANSKHLEDYPE